MQFHSQDLFVNLDVANEQETKDMNYLHKLETMKKHWEVNMMDLQGAKATVCTEDWFEVVRHGVCVDGSLEDGVHKERGAHQLHEESASVGHGRVLEAIGAKAAGSIEGHLVVGYRGAQKCSAADGAHHLGDRVQYSADGMAFASKGERKRDGTVDVAA